MNPLLIKIHTVALSFITTTANAPAAGLDKHQSRLQNITDGTTIAYGTSENNTVTSSGDAVGTQSLIKSIFSVATPKTIELQHQSSQTQAIYGFGFACGFSGASEIYSQIKIIKVG